MFSNGHAFIGAVVRYRDICYSVFNSTAAVSVFGNDQIFFHFIFPHNKGPVCAGAVVYFEILASSNKITIGSNTIHNKKIIFYPPLPKE